MIRLRVQTVQFLLSCRTLEAYLEWLEALSAAIDLAPSLDERSLPRYQTLPRRRRRRHAATQPADESAQQQQVNAIRRNLTPFAEAQEHRNRTQEAPPTASSSSGGSERQIASDQESIHDREDIGILTPTIRTTAPAQRRPQHSSGVDENGKWAPRNAFSREAQMRYAQRCMAVLCADAPRQSDYVIFQGQRYRLMWESKMMVPDVVGGGAPVLATVSEKRPATSRGKAKMAVVTVEDQPKKMPRLPEYEEVVEGIQEVVRIAVAC